MRSLILCLASLALVQCSSPKSPPPAPPPPPPAPKTQPAPVPSPAASNWEDLPASPGDWSYRLGDRGSVAAFGVDGADAELLVRCFFPERRLTIGRKAVPPTGAPAQLTLRATSAMQSYPLDPTLVEPGYAIARLSPTDRQLDALAFSRGRFLVSIRGTSDLIVPAWPELTRVIEDCRS